MLYEQSTGLQQPPFIVLAYPCRCAGAGVRGRVTREERPPHEWRLPGRNPRSLSYSCPEQSFCSTELGRRTDAGSCHSWWDTAAPGWELAEEAAVFLAAPGVAELPAHWAWAVWGTGQVRAPMPCTQCSHWSWFSCGNISPFTVFFKNNFHQLWLLS